MSRLPEINLLLVGVGGQGIITAGDILARVGLAAGLEAQKSEVHGMAQRGGSVESHVRLGPEVLSPLIPRGKAGALVALEQAEALRYLDYPAGDALVMLTSTRVVPPGVSLGIGSYPREQDILAQVSRCFSRTVFIDVREAERQLGGSRAINLFILGKLSAYLPFEAPLWSRALRQVFSSRNLEENLAAFELGRAGAGQGSATY